MKTQKLLERIDMGLDHWGSFGGKLSENDPVNNRPALFVHGALARAAVFLAHREYFIYRGYSWSELYATSYGNGINSAIFDGVHCKYIKQIRQMLVAVNNYTGKTVDIIAHSMGSAVTRKAILGSYCFDTDELLGAPLTQMVNTFISVGGTNHGLQTCPSIIPLCSSASSLSCNSKLMKELNSQPNRFEGRNSYDVYSLSDSIIGLNCCNKSCAALRNHNVPSFVVADLDHFALLTETVTLQLSLLKQGGRQYNDNNTTRIDYIDSEDDIKS
ncbi:unnamed protein product [Litomosoides sigmodontis]|nr:unnamed protein product [Litomosoides sigmodontis]